MMSAALFGRRSKRGTDDLSAPPSPPGGAGPSSPNVFSPDAAPPPPVAEPVSAPEADPSVPTEAPPADSGGEDGGREHDDLISGPLLAELEARVHSNHPAPHPVRPQELWHPDVTPQPVDLPPPPTEERIDQAELESTEGAPGRFRFNRLRRVSPGEAAVEPPDVPARGARVPEAEEEPIGDVLFGELFTSDRIPSGGEGLGSDAAPLVPQPGGAPGGLINGPVRRNPRGSGRALTPRPELQPRVEVPTEQAETNPRDGLPVPAPMAALDDHDADPVVEPTVVAEQEPVARTPAVDADGSVELGDASLRLAPDAEATVTDDGTVCSVALVAGWCWAALGDSERQLTITTDGIVLQCPEATTALVTVDDTGRFVVVVRGEAVLAVGSRRIRLRAGAMAFLPHGSGEAQVDVATEAEITADPLVTRNLELDAQR